MSIISLAVHGCLIHGVNNRKEELLEPHLAFTPLQMILHLAEIGLAAIALHAAAWKVIIMSAAFTSIYAFAWLVVLSRYFEIKEKKMRGSRENLIDNESC